MDKLVYESQIKSSDRIKIIPGNYLISLILGLLNEMVRFVQPQGKWKIMVVDPISIKVITNAMKMYDVLDENVTCMYLTLQLKFSFLPVLQG
jgi:ubiquinone/menaquinone biosynthesis C-methylase UbiE